MLPGLAVAGPKLSPIRSGDFRSFSKLNIAVPGSDGVHVTVGLSGFHKDWADRFVEDISNPNSPNYRHWITTTEFGQYFGASDGDIQAISDYLVSQGFQNINVAEARNYISADGTIDQAAAAFHTSFATFARPAELVAKGEPTTVFGPSQPAALPEGLASKVSGVGGLDNLVILHSSLKKAKASRRSPIQGYTPKQMSTGYNNGAYVNSHPGHNMKIAVYSPTARYKSDPEEFASRLGIPQDFLVVDVNVDGGNTSLSGAGEAALDAETILGQANHAQIFMITCPNSNGGELDSYNWVGKQKDIPILSSSWAGLESQYTGPLGNLFPGLFEQTCESLSAAGITIFVASGDDAWYGSGGAQSVQMESSCPYVTAVGGTELFLDANNKWSSEKLWAYNGNRKNPSGGGGGESTIFTRPTWQTFDGTSNTYTNGFRMSPDVSANASSSSGYYAVINGKNSTNGGTSIATPLWASNLLLMEQNWGDDGAKDARVGCINATIYTMGNYYENPDNDLTLDTIFHDITSGSNGHFHCTTGFDLCAGWGSSDFGRLWTDASYLIGFNNLSPDLKPYSPSGWTHPLTIHASTGNETEPSTFEHGVKYYFSAAAENVGTADAPTFPFSVEIDGKTVITASFKSVPIGGTIQWANFYDYTFTKGNHTILYTVNVGGKIKEADKSNNTYSRTITVK